MRTVKWEPKEYDSMEPVLDGDGSQVIDEITKKAKFKTVKKDPIFSGFLTVEIPPYRERLKLMKECNFAMSGSEMGSNSSGMDSLEAMAKMACDRIKEVKLVRIEDDMAFDNLEDLEYDKEGSEIINQIGSMLIEGFKMGKN